jgi:hypothetical protein
LRHFAIIRCKLESDRNAVHRLRFFYTRMCVIFHPDGIRN